ncbi:hypothetical protein DL769_008814 [Monosporascus sp. CRB-8-3]|nr:hypothetical protein DL769_008814 [Monosporascus sp. CRB-8-3]
MSEGVPLGVPVASHPARRPERKAIEGRCAKLVPLDESHIPALYQQLCNAAAAASVWAYMWVGPFESEDEFGKYVREIIPSENPIYYTVITNENLPSGARAGTPVGFLSLGRIDLANRSIEVGDVTFSAALQRTTAATEALYLAMRYCVEDLGNRRLEWRCDSLHAKSRRAAERLGFTYEGLFRQFKIFRGRNRDTTWYSVTDGDWTGQSVDGSGSQGVGLRRMFDIWLDPSNFVEGRQVRSLEKVREDLKSGRE